MPLRVRLGIVGAGGFATTHMQFLSQIPDVEVVALCRRDAVALGEMQRQWKVPHAFTDHREMLQLDGLDAVDIITPTDSHHRIAMDAIAAGKHVLCEKPLAMTAAQCKEMLETADRARVVHCTNFNQRGRTPVGRMKRYIDQGFIGKTYHCTITWMMSLQYDARPNIRSWRFRPESGGGIVHEVVHVLDMARFLCGEVKRVHAVLHTSEKHRKFPDVPDGMVVAVPDSAGYFLEFQSGAYGVVHTSFLARGCDPDGNTTARVEVTGEAGRIMSHGRFGLLGYSTSFGAGQGPPRELDPGEPYPQPYEQFVRAILTGEPVKTSFYDGYKAVQLVEAAYESAREGRWVEIPHGP